jgi:hypothetical protein
MEVEEMHRVQLYLISNFYYFVSVAQASTCGVPCLQGLNSTG